MSVVSETREVFEDHLYSPSSRAVVCVLDMVRRIQTGKINSYLLYIMIVTIALLVLVVFQP